MNGLDIEATILIRQIIHEYAAQGTAFLISSHVLSELQKVMTSVIILNHHEIVMNVPIDQFKNAPVTQYQIKTLDNEAAAKILKANDIFYRRQNQSLFINIADIDQVQTILRHHQMMLRELVPVRKTFEQSIVEVLKEKLVDE